MESASFLECTAGHLTKPREFVCFLSTAPAMPQSPSSHSPPCASGTLTAQLMAQLNVYFRRFRTAHKWQPFPVARGDRNWRQRKGLGSQAGQPSLWPQSQVNEQKPRSTKPRRLSLIISFVSCSGHFCPFRSHFQNRFRIEIAELTLIFVC